MKHFHTHTMHAARGFTLVELLVALGIFAIMAAIAYSGLNAVLDTRHDVDVAMQRMQNLQAAIFRIRSDLLQSVPRTIRDQLGDSRPAMAGSANTGLAFTRNGWRNPLRSKRSHLQRVLYRVNDKNQLVRLHWRVLDRAQGSEPVKTVLLDDVVHIEWRFMDAGRSWQDRWPPTSLAHRLGPVATAATASLPRAVELHLETKTMDNIHCLFFIPAGGRQ